MGEIIENIFARGDIAGEIAPFRGGDFREATLHQRFAGRDDLDHGGVPRLANPASIEAMRLGTFIAVIR